MALADVHGVVAVVEAANADADRRQGRDTPVHTAEQRQAFERSMARFVERDPDGAWVAVTDEDGRVVGMAEAIRRGGFWGLSMLFVDPDWQSRGVGRALLERALNYAQGASVRMIVASSDPRALRRYWSAGLRLYPGVQAAGRPDTGAVPADLPGRQGEAGDLDLVAEVDSDLRGSRAEDAAFLLSLGNVLEVVDGPEGRGYAVRSDERMHMLGATDTETARLLVWRFLQAAGPTATLPWLTATQGWAIDVAMAAGLTLRPQGALFVDGLESPPGPWLPSGWFF